MTRDKNTPSGRRLPRLNLIQIQDRYIERVNGAFNRWSHRSKPAWTKAGGHYSRIRGAAVREALRNLMKWGLTEEQARAAITQADDMAELERTARFS